MKLHSCVSTMKCEQVSFDCGTFAIPKEGAGQYAELRLWDVPRGAGRHIVLENGGHHACQCVLHLALAGVCHVLQGVQPPQHICCVHHLQQQRIPVVTFA